MGIPGSGMMCRCCERSVSNLKETDLSLGRTGQVVSKVGRGKWRESRCYVGVRHGNVTSTLSPLPSHTHTDLCVCVNEEQRNGEGVTL